MLPNVFMYFAASILPAERVASFLSSTIGDFRLGPFDAIFAAYALAYLPFGFRLVYSMVALPQFSDPKTLLNARAAVTEIKKTDAFVAASEICYDNYQETC